MRSRLPRSWRRVTALLVLVSFLHAPMVPSALAEDSTLIRISKSTIYGGLLGLLLGSAVAIVVEDDRDEPIRWGLALGVFGGFAYGVYSASTGRDDFFQRSAGSMDTGRYRLPVRTEPEAWPAALAPTPLRTMAGESERRSEFSPYLVRLSEGAVTARSSA